MVKYLIEHGADPDDEMSHDFLPLHLAVMANDLEMVKYLVEKAHVRINQNCHGVPFYIFSSIFLIF